MRIAIPSAQSCKIGEVDLDAFQDHKRLSSVYAWLENMYATSFYGYAVAIAGGPNTGIRIQEDLKG